MGRIKNREFFTRPAEELAKDLIGKVLCHATNEDGETFVIKGRIKVTEAYLHDESMTDGNRKKNETSQALEGGHLYLNTKTCEGRKRLDVVANVAGVSEGVLICSVDPYDGPQTVVWGMDIPDDADGMDMLAEDTTIWIEDDGTEVEFKEPAKRKNVPDDTPLRFAAKSFIFK